MPLFYQYIITDNTKLAVWHITEDESFFLSKVPLHREITHPHKRLQHLAGRYLLQYTFPDFPSSLIEIADTKKPFLPNEQFHFSISHCDDYAAVLVSTDKRVGIDVETITPKVERVKHKFLNVAELAGLSGSSHSQLNDLTVLWSAKECVFKWHGEGNVDFREDIKLLDTVTNSDGVIRCTFVNGDSTELEIIYKTFEQICLAWVVT